MRARKKLSKRMLALLLSAVMIAEPASSAMIVHATEAETALTAPEVTPEENEGATGQKGTEAPDSMDEGVKEEITDGQESEVSSPDDQENEGSDENQSDDQDGEKEENGTDPGAEEQNPDDQKPEDQNPDEQNPEDGEDVETQEPEEGVEVSDEELEESEADEEEKTDEDSIGIMSMPSDYNLTSEQKQMKSALSASMGDFDDSAEGVQYVEKQVFTFADSREEAEVIAEAFHAELIEYDEGIAVLRLQETSVGETLRAAAAADNNLPAVYPDYYRYIHVEEHLQDNQAVEVTEEEYELDMDTFDSSGFEEPSLKAYEQVIGTLSEPNMEYDSDYYQWQHVNVGSVYAWGADYKGQGVTVAVLDSGVSGNTDIVPIENINKTAEPDATDTNGHGTHVAGIIAAQLNGVGGAGIAPEANIINVKIANAAGSTQDSLIIQGIRAAIGKADIMNLSIGGLGANPAVQKVVDEAYENGIALFVSAGNDGGSVMCYPAACDHVICVAAIDNNNQRASFSNYGAWVDLSAPGVDIWSTGNDGDFEIMSGTSQASPVAAGEAAVILSSGMLDAKSGKSKVDALESLMKSNTVSAGSGMGKGVTSLTKVFKLSTAVTKPTAPVIIPVVATDGQSVEFTIEAQAGAKIYYTDNGKSPSFKNGVEGSGTTLAESNPVTLTYTSKDALNKITVSAIAVNESGVASAVKKVTATIKPWVTDIEISGVSRIAKGKSTQLTAEVTPSYATNKAVVWSIDGNPANISVNAKGKVTTKPGVEAKEYTVRVTAKDRQGKPDEISKPYTVIVTENPVYIQSAKFKKATGTVNIGDQPISYNVVTEGEFTPVAKSDYAGEVSPADFVWSSSNKTLASVDAMGTVTAKAAGNVKITAIANDGSNQKAVFSLTIRQLATSVEIVGDDKVAAGASITLKAEIKPIKANNKKIEWTSSDPVNVPVKNGVVKPKAGVSGSYTITAKAVEGTDQAVDTKNIEVKKGKITGIIYTDKSAKTIFRTNGKTNAAQSVEFTANISGTEDCALNAYTCTSSNPGIATALATGDNGTVTITVTATGKAAGKTTITLMATDGSKKKATCNVNVCNPVSKVHIAPTAGNSYYVAKKKSLQLKATLESEYGVVSNKKVEWELWTTNNYPVEGAVAQRIEGDLATELGLSISKTGKVTAKDKAEPGLIVVRAYASDGSGAMAQYPVIVTDPVKTIAMWSDAWNTYGRYEEMTSKYVYNLPLVIVPYSDDSADGTKPYPFDMDLMCDWELVTKDGQTYYEFSYPAGGVSVSSSNPKVLSVQKITDQATGMPMIRLSPGSLGSATITVKAMDGGGAQTKIKFKVVKPKTE